MHSLILMGHCSQLIHWHVIITSKSKSTLGAKRILSYNPSPSFCSCYLLIKPCMPWVNFSRTHEWFIFLPLPHRNFHTHSSTGDGKEEVKMFQIIFQKKTTTLFLTYDEWDRDIKRYKDKNKCTSTLPQTKMLAHPYTKSLKKYLSVYSQF